MGSMYGVAPANEYSASIQFLGPGPYARSRKRAVMCGVTTIDE
jgi:hypothetical protein